MKKQLYRAAAATVLGLSLMTGVAAAATGNINQTGADSYNKVKSSVSNKVHVQNNNNVNATSSNGQSASTGSANSSQNTTGGGAASGAAANGNSVAANVMLDNSGSAVATPVVSGDNGQASISNTGYNSDNVVKSTVTSDTKVENNNNVNLSTSNSQSAYSGSANVSQNTTGGSATTGNATNSSSSVFTFDITN